MNRFFRFVAIWGMPLVLLSGCGSNSDALPTEDLGHMKPAPVEASVFLENYIAQPKTDFELFRKDIVARGIYVTSNVAGLSKALDNRLEISNGTEINAMAIDVKDEFGKITFKNKIPYADELGISVNNIPNFDDVMAKLKDNNVYTIARMVVFKDDSIAEIYPDYAIHLSDGSIYREKKGSGLGLTWLNPYNRDVWEYTANLAKGAAALGFDEIQFDYVRFPTDSNVKNADFGETGGLSKIEILNEFSKYVVGELKPYGVKVSADIFGTIITSSLDATLIGQDIVELAKIYDIICPMVYPSHYANGSLGIDFPDLQPYDTIYKAMQETVEKLSVIEDGEHVAVVRPWLQDFTATWVKPHQDYGAVQLREQIQGCYDAGVNEWLLWSPSNKYSVDGLLPQEQSGE